MAKSEKIKQDGNIQYESMKTILEKFPEYIYISDPTTYEIVFANQKLKDITGNNLLGKKCYKVLQGKTKPCDFCTNDLILKTKLPHVWDHENTHLGRHFLHTDQIIEWPDGREVRFETAIDITDQKKIEKILKESEDRYWSFIETASYGFFIMDVKEQITYVNNQASEICGLKMADGEVLQISDLIYKDDLERARKSLELIASGTNVERPGIYRLKHVNGDIRTTEINTMPIYKDNLVIGFHGTVVDITLRVKSQDLLKEKTEFLDAVINNTTDGIFVINEDFNYVLINPASGRILGHNPEEWIGKKAGTHKHPDDEKSSMEAIMKVMNGEPASSEMRVKSLDGTYHLLDIRYNPMMLNEEFHILGMVTDITEKKKAQTELKKSEEKFRNLFEYFPDSIVILNTEGLIIECNTVTMKLFRQEKDNILGQTLDQICIMDKIDLDYFNQVINSVINGSRVERFELVCTCEDGTDKWLELSPIIQKSQDSIYGIQLIIKDITKRKRKEVEMKKKLMRFELEEGNLYLAKETRPMQSLEAFRELLTVGYPGTLITRESKKDYDRKLDFMFRYIKVSESNLLGSGITSPESITEIISEMPRGEAIMIDCLEYCISRIGIQKTLKMIQDLRDLVIDKHMIVILSLDPIVIDEKELKLIELETRTILHSESLIKLPEKLLETLRYIGSLNKDGVRPSYSDLGSHFDISKPYSVNFPLGMKPIG